MTYYGVCTYNEEDQPVWHFVGAQMECYRYIAGIASWTGCELPFIFVRELIGDHDEVWAIRAQVARARGEPEPVLFEQDEPIALSSEVDTEKELNDNLHIFEEYIKVTKKLRDLDAKYWDPLKRARTLWWSYFKEEMDTNWLELDVYDRKLNRIRGVYERYCLIPTKAMWDEAFRRRSIIFNRCLKKQQNRREFTYSIYQKAKKATERCRAFWSTNQGKLRTDLATRRGELWEQIQQLDVTFSDYNQLVDLVFDPYWCNQDLEEREEQDWGTIGVYETLEALEESHYQEMEWLYRERRGKGFWDWREAKPGPMYFVRLPKQSKSQKDGLQPSQLANGRIPDEDWDSLMSSDEGPF